MIYHRMDDGDGSVSLATLGMPIRTTSGWVLAGTPGRMGIARDSLFVD